MGFVEHILFVFTIFDLSKIELEFIMYQNFQYIRGKIVSEKIQYIPLYNISIRFDIAEKT